MDPINKILETQTIMKTQQPITTHTSENERQAFCNIHECGYLSKLTMGRWWTGCPKCYEDSMNKRLDNDIKSVSIAQKIPWLSKRSQNMSLSTFSPRTDAQAKILSRVKKYVENFKNISTKGSCIVLYGPPGTGKTHLAVGIGVAITKKGHSVHYERLYDLTRRIKATYSKGATDSEKEIIDRLKEFDLLILDEVGLKDMTETEITLTYEIIDARYEDVKPTIIVSNLCEKALQDNLGDRTIDRLYENHGVFLKFDGESVRRKWDEKQ